MHFSFILTKLWFFHTVEGNCYREYKQMKMNFAGRSTKRDIECKKERRGSCDKMSYYSKESFYYCISIFHFFYLLNRARILCLLITQSLFHPTNTTFYGTIAAVLIEPKLHIFIICTIYIDCITRGDTRSFCTLI